MMFDRKMRRLFAGAAVAILAGGVGAPSVTIAADKEPVKMDPRAKPGTFDPDAFIPDPQYEEQEYDVDKQLEIYGGKFPVPTPRPLIELGREIYTGGPFKESSEIFGDRNPVLQTFYVYGDWRTAVAFNDNGDNEVSQIATRLNLDVDWRITSTERIHAFFQPFDRNGKFTRCEFGGGSALSDDEACQLQFDLNPDALFFEGDVGAIMTGLTGEYASFDMPIALGLIPLLFQNGVWVEDAFVGGAVTIPAQNSASLDISNMDITFFGAFDKVTSQGVLDNDGQVADHSVSIYGVTAFIETMRGYWEVGYGFTDGRDGLNDQDYHNITAAFSKRYGGWLSNSVRVLGNFGQDKQANGERNANGVLLLIENSLVTHKPLTLLPYLNLFVGIDRPQSLARAGGAGGVLKNTGINFETDGLTGFPKLDDTANDTYGGALGLSYLFNLDQQIVVEFATVQTIGRDNAVDRNAKGAEYGLGVRYQLPLDKAWIFRADAMHGWREQDENLFGIRAEIRRKF